MELPEPSMMVGEDRLQSMLEELVATVRVAVPTKPFSDDTANSGERLNENDAVSLANPTASANVFGAFRYHFALLQEHCQHYF